MNKRIYISADYSEERGDRDVVNALEDIFYYLANNNERQYNEWREYHREVIAREFPLFAKFL